MPLDAEALEIGSILSEPLVSQSGRTLLQPGVRITPDIKRWLLSFSKRQPSGYRLDSYASQLPGSNRSRFGCTPYDPNQIEKLERQFQSSTEKISDLVVALGNGGIESAAPIDSISKTYLDALSQDVDHVLSMTNDVEANLDLSSRSLRLAILCMAIGMEMEMPTSELVQLGTAGLVHDWGLYSRPPALRYFHEEMTPPEREAFELHPYAAFQMLRMIPDVPNETVIAVTQVHERLDGSGYPRRISGDSIKCFGRILGLADAYLALTAPRDKNLAVVPCDAVAYLLGQTSKRRFDARVIRAFLQAMAQFPVGSLLQLSDKRQVKVLRGNGKLYACPIVEDLLSNEIIDLATEDVHIVRPILRHDPVERRLKPQYRSLNDCQDLPLSLDSTCFEA